MPTEPIPSAEADLQRLVHELQVHQIELELQNEELRRTRDEVEAGLEKYSDLYDFAPVGYLTLDPAGTIREANLASTSLLGMERSRLLQRRLGHFVSVADQPVLNAFLTRVFAGRAQEGCEVTLLQEGPRPVVVRIEAAAVASGRECRAVLEDITERKRAEADQLRLRKHEAAETLAGGLAQDYSNLLTTILLNLELAQTLVPRGEEFLARRLQAAEEAAQRAQDLTQQLTAVAPGDVRMRQATSLAGLVRASVQTAMNGSPVRCEYSLAENLWPAHVDAGQIGQALRKVAMNAREAMPRGGMVSVRAENLVLDAPGQGALPPGAYVRVSLRDQGGGIAPEVLPRVFDPCFSTKQRGKHPGVGLGLTLCQAVIQKHEGALVVESTVGVGTIVHLYLPAVRTPGEQGPLPAARSRRTDV